MERSAIEENNRRFCAALARGDAAGAASVYADGALLLPPDLERIAGRDGIRAFWAAAIRMGVRGAELVTDDIEGANGIAYEVGAYRLRLEGDAVQAGKYVVIHKRQPDGCWKWAVEIFNADGPPA